MSCNHYIQFKNSRLREALKNLKDPKQCTSCDNKEAPWLCLSCYIINCGRYTENAHALEHYNSRKHPLAFSVSTLEIWCYACDESLSVIADSFTSESKRERVKNMIDEVQLEFMTYIKKVEKDARHSSAAEDMPKKPAQAKKEERKNHLSRSIQPSYNAIAKSKPPGLPNLGNTCFFNAALQCLRATKDLQTLISSGEVSNQLLSSLGKSYSGIQQLHGGVAKRFPHFRGYGQHDSHELLRCLLDMVHTACQNDIKKSDEPIANPIDQVFGGKLMSTVFCKGCERNYRKIDPILDLSLEIAKKKMKRPINELEFNEIPPEELPEEYKTEVLREPSECFVESDRSLLGCLEHFTSIESLDDKNNLYDCEFCRGKRPATRRFLILEPPKNLVIHLKRFSRKRFGFEKIGDHIEFEPVIDIGRFVATCGRSTSYELYAIDVHSGGMFGGHYIAYVKHGEDYFVCSDSSVSPSTEAKALRAQAYILFYRRIDN